MVDGKTRAFTNNRINSAIRTKCCFCIVLYPFLYFFRRKDFQAIEAPAQIIFQQSRFIVNAVAMCFYNISIHYHQNPYLIRWFYFFFSENSSIRASTRLVSAHFFCFFNRRCSFLYFFVPLRLFEDDFFEPFAYFSTAQLGTYISSLL